MYISTVLPNLRVLVSRLCIRTSLTTISMNDGACLCVIGFMNVLRGKTLISAYRAWIQVMISTTRKLFLPDSELDEQ